MAKYHEIGRFLLTPDSPIDWTSALFHEKHAAELGVLEALITLARLYLGLQRDVLTDCPQEVSINNTNCRITAINHFWICPNLMLKRLEMRIFLGSLEF